MIRRAWWSERAVPVALLLVAAACSGPGGDDAPSGSAPPEEPGVWNEVERWECFAVVREGYSLHLFFKRPVKSYLRHIPVSDLWKQVPGKGEGDAGE